MNDKDREFISEEGRRINAMPVLSSLEEMLEEDFSAWCKTAELLSSLEEMLEEDFSPRRKTAEFPDYADFILVKFFGQSNPYSINEVNRFY